MYFKDFPQFLYDFNYGDKVKTTVVTDITRNIRFKKEILSNIALYDEYDIVDGETPEMIAEKFYGTPEYHWVIMIANEKYDYRKDFPLTETVLQKHIETTYNPTLISNDWKWVTHDDGKVYIYIRITQGTAVPFDPDYLTAPVDITLYDITKQFTKTISFPHDELTLDFATQYFIFPYGMPWDITQFGTGDQANGVGTTTIYVDTKGREHNPVKYLNSAGHTVDPKTTTEGIPLTGDVVHRNENDTKRRIKIISPSLIESILRNYEDELR